MTYTEYYEGKREREASFSKEQNRAKHEIERQLNARLAQLLSEDKEISRILDTISNNGYAVRILLDGMTDTEVIELN